MAEKQSFTKNEWMLYKKKVFVFDGIAVIVAIAIVVHVPSTHVCVSREYYKQTNTQRQSAQP